MIETIFSAFGLRLVPGIASFWHRLWSLRLTLIWGLICGLYSALPAFQDLLPVYVFAPASMIMCAAIAIARVTQQPGVDA